MSDKNQRTEPPTQRRIEKARKEGNFAVSRDFVSALQFLAFVALAASLGAEAIGGLGRLMRALLRFGFEQELTPARVARVFSDVLVPACLPLLAAGGLLVAVGFGVQLLTTGMGFALKKLRPDFKRLDPVQRLRNLPRQNVPQFVQAAVLLPLFLFIVYWVATSDLPVFLALPLMDAPAAMAELGGILEGLLWKAAAAFLVLGMIDLARQRRRYRQDLKMTKQEVRDELKEVEGDPHVKARIRRLQRALLERRMMDGVARSTAVVVNPTHYAVALRYEPESMAAPRVLAKGKNHMARRIREKALELEIPIVENPPLARALYDAVEVGQEIPVHLYRAVAEILAYIYRVMGGRLPGAEPRSAWR